MKRSEPTGTVNPLDEVELPVEVRLGNVDLTLEQILRVAPGSVVSLGPVSDEPVELAVSGVPYARGELVVVEGHFAFRVASVNSDAPGERVDEVGATAAAGDTGAVPEPTPAPEPAPTADGDGSATVDDAPSPAGEPG